MLQVIDEPVMIAHPALVRPEPQVSWEGFAPLPVPAAPIAEREIPAPMAIATFDDRRMVAQLVAITIELRTLRIELESRTLAARCRRAWAAVCRWCKAATRFRT